MEIWIELGKGYKPSILECILFCINIWSLGFLMAMFIYH